MDSKKLNYLERPYIMGQSNFDQYRNLAFLYPSYKLIEMIFDIKYIFKEQRIKLPFPGSYPRMEYNFKELEKYLLNRFPKDVLKNKISNFFSNEVGNKLSLTRYAYVLFDIFYRNQKFNKNKSLSYKFLYSFDLALWHSMATFAFPLYASLFSFGIFKMIISIPKNRYFTLNVVSAFASLYSFLYLVKVGDFTADLVMNNTYRKIVFDYKINENNEFTIEYDKLKELDNTSF